MYVYHHHIIYLSIKYTGNINEETILHLNTIKIANQLLINAINPTVILSLILKGHGVR